MARILGETRHRLSLQDPVSGSAITLYYRLPSTEERVAYLKAAAAKRRSGEPEEILEEAESAAEITLAPERLAELERAEEFVLTVTSGGYGHYVDRSLAQGYVPVALAGDLGQGAFEVEIIGDRRKATVVAEPLFDPQGRRMRM